MSLPSSNLPNPDPTIATIALLYREIEAVTEARHHEIESLREIIEARLAGYDRAIALLHDDLTAAPSDADKQIAHLDALLRAIMDERTLGVQKQFEERDVRQRRDAEQVKLAVDAALQAAKEAVSEQNKGFTLIIDKSEAAITKQIDSLGARLSTATAGLEGQIADVKDRLTRLESTGLGRSQQVAENRAQAVDMRGVILMCVGLISLAIALAGFAVRS